MPTALLTWELGSGLGHMGLLAPLADGLALRGFRVVLALRNLASAARAFAGTPVEFLPAPTFTGRLAGASEPIATYVQLLHRFGFGNADELDVLVQAWRNLFACVRPDVIVANSSPTALLAARGLGTPVVAVGTGFCCPADCNPYPDWRPELRLDPRRHAREEQLVCDNANAVLRRRGAPPLARIGELFRGSTDALLLTYPELDPFGPRAGADYFGVWPDPTGKSPTWPPGRPRALVYLRPLAGVRTLLATLAKRGVSAILRIPEADERLRREFDLPNLRWEDDYLDLEATLDQCDDGRSPPDHAASWSDKVRRASASRAAA